MIGIGNIIQLAGNGGNGSVSPDLSALQSDVINLENNEYKYLYWQSVSSSSGQVTAPVQGEILLDEIETLDALVETISGGKPTGQSPQTSGGNPVVVSTFDTSGNYVLSGTPSAYPVAVLFVFKIKAKFIQNVNQSNVIVDEQIGLMIGASSTANGKEGKVSAPVATQQFHLFQGNGQWTTSPYVTEAKESTSISFTGLTANTKVGSIFLPKGKYDSTKKIMTLIVYYATAGTVRLYLNTSDSISGAILIASNVASNFTSRNVMIFNSSTLKTLNPNATSGGDNGNFDTIVNFNLNQDFYFIVAIQPVNSSEVFKMNLMRFILT